MTTSLAERARLALIWTAAVHVIRDLIQFGLMLVLVRLVSPDAYGQFGLVSTIVAFMTVFSSREFIAHTLLVRDDESVNYQEQFVAGCVIQGTLFAIANGVAVILRFVPAYAPVAPLLHLMSALFLVDLPSELRTKMLERQLDWRRLRTLEVVGVLGGALLAIALALQGAGTYALVASAFVLPTVLAVDLFVGAGWRPTFVWRRERFIASRDFGLKRVLSQTFVNASGLLESGVLARVVGFAGLGVFGRASGMSMLFCQRVTTLLMSALYPVLTRLPRESDAFRRGSALVLRTTAWAVIPIATVVSLMAEDVVHTLYGARWVTVIPLVRAAMTVGAAIALVHASYSLLLAHGETKRCLYLDVWRLIGMGVALAAGLPFGVLGYFQGLVLVHGAALGVGVYWLHAASGVRISGVMEAFLPAAVAAALSAGAVELIRWVLPTGLDSLSRLLVCGAVFAGSYVAILRVLFASQLGEIVSYLPSGQRVHRLLGLAPVS